MATVPSLKPSGADLGYARVGNDHLKPAARGAEGRANKNEGKEKHCTEIIEKTKNQKQQKQITPTDATYSSGVADSGPRGHMQKTPIDESRLEGQISNEARKLEDVQSSNAQKERRLDQTVESADVCGAAAATTGEFFQTTAPCGIRPKPCCGTNSGEQPEPESANTEQHLAATKRILRDFSMTIVAAGDLQPDRALASVNSAFVRQIERHLRAVTGKNAKKRVATALEEYCATLRAERLAELKAKLSANQTAPDTDNEDGDDLDEPFGEHYGDTADPKGGEDWG
jgi:hypothetical protein